MPERMPHDGGQPWGGGPWTASGREWRPPRWATLWLPVIVSLVVQVPAAVWAIRTGAQASGVAAPTLALALAGPLALIAARRAPGPVVAFATAATVAALLLLESGGPPPAALAFAVVSAVVRGARVWAWVSLAVGWAGAITVGALTGTESWTPLRIVGTSLGMLVALGIGEGIRSRRERMREFRAVAERRRMTAAEAERVRIARELHDVLAHSLSQINVQAGVGLHLAETQPEKAVEALAAIKLASKTALDDVRAVLGVLRSEDGAAPRAPQAGIAQLPGLVAGVEIPGATVSLEHDGAQLPVAAPVGAAIFRIVQEALTNITRHGRGVTRVVVRLETDEDEVRVAVRDDGEPASLTPGRGILGMRERVELLGGRFELTSDTGGGVVVRAALPRGESR